LRNGADTARAPAEAEEAVSENVEPVEAAKDLSVAACWSRASVIVRWKLRLTWRATSEKRISLEGWISFEDEG
jgi:hypothetical protein